MSEEVVAQQPADGVVSSAEPAESVPNAQNPAEQAPADPPGEPIQETPEQAAKRQGRRFERKLSKAIREGAEAKARAELAERRLTELERGQQPAKDAGEPKLEDFTDIVEFQKAVAKHASETTKKELEANRTAEAQRQYAKTLSGEWAKKVEAAESRYDDFDEVVGEIKPDSYLAVALLEADNGPDIAYHLATHKDELAVIAQLSPSGQIRAVGRLEAKLAAEPPKPQNQSSAPAPIKPVGGSSAPSTKKLSEMTQDEFEKKRRAQIAARR